RSSDEHARARGQAVHRDAEAGERAGLRELPLLRSPEDPMSDHCKGAKLELVTLGAKRAPEHWKSPEDLHHPAKPRGEFPGGLPVAGRDDDDGTTRRDFLTLMGFGAAAASVAACRAPEQKAIPLPVASDELIPGVANFYATTCGGCAS